MKNAMRIVIARHMETVDNQRGIILGRQDSPPVESALQHSRQIAALMVYPGTGLVVSSPLGRAVSTAGIFSTILNWEMDIMENFTELSCGKWEGRPRLSVLQPGCPLRRTWHERPGDGESCQSASHRVAEGIRRLKSLDYDTILIVGHAAVNQVFLRIWLSLTPAEALTIQHPHDLLYQVDPPSDRLSGDWHVFWTHRSGAAGEGLWLRK